MCETCFKPGFSDCFIRVVFGFVCFLNEIFDIFIKISMANMVYFVFFIKIRENAKE